MDRESFQKLLANAFAMQQSHIDSQSLSAILEVGRLFTRGEVDVDGAMFLIGERVRRASQANGTNGGTAVAPALDMSIPIARAGKDDRVSGAFLSHLASTLSAEGNAAVSADVALDLVLQEIVLRASLLIKASGAIIALKRGDGMVCRASTGPNAPPPGVRLSSPFDLSPDSSTEPEVCDDTQADSHFDSIALGRLGIRSFVIVPLLKKGELAGLIEVFSSRARAFGDREIETLRVLSEEILVNVDSASEQLGFLPTAGSGSAEDDDNSRFDLLVEPPTVEVSRVAAAEAKAEVEDQDQDENEDQDEDQGEDEPSVNRALADPEPLFSAQDAESLVDAHDEPLQSFQPLPLPLIKEPPAAREDADAAIAGFRILPQEAETKHFGVPDFRSPLVVAPLTALLLVLGWMLARAIWPAGGRSQAPAQVIATPASVPAQTAPQTNPAPPAQARQSFPRPAVPSDPSPDKVQLIRRVEPQYPEAAKKRNIQGEVALEVGVDTNGSVDDLAVISGDPVLTPAAINAVSQWRFKPFLQDGQAIPFHIQIKVHFVLR
jgi:periplasmic protein TonB